MLGAWCKFQHVINLAGSLKVTDHVSIISIPKSIDTYSSKMPHVPSVCKKKNSYKEWKVMCQEHVDARGYKSLVTSGTNITKTKNLATQKQNLSKNRIPKKEWIQRSTTSMFTIWTGAGFLPSTLSSDVGFLLPRSTFRWWPDRLAQKLCWESKIQNVGDCWRNCNYLWCWSKPFYPKKSLT